MWTCVGSQPGLPEGKSSDLLDMFHYLGAVYLLVLFEQIGDSHPHTLSIGAMVYLSFAPTTYTHGNLIQDGCTYLGVSIVFFGYSSSFLTLGGLSLPSIILTDQFQESEGFCDTTR